MTIDGHPVFATRRYDELAAHVIVGVKDDHKRWLLPLLTEAIVTAASPLVGQSQKPVVLTPVPSSKRSVRRRGEDVVLQLCMDAARRFQSQGENVLARSLLVHRRRVRDQSGLSAAERAKNLRGAFALKARPPAGVALVVVDDVLTTGASMREAAATLGPHGFVGGAVATST